MAGDQKQADPKERSFPGKQTAFGAHMAPPHRLPAARMLGETSLMLQVHPTLSLRDMEDTCAAVEKVMLAATDEQG